MLRKLLAVFVLVVLGILAVPTAEAARTDNRSKAVYFIHGYENGSNSDCDKWDDMTNAFDYWGHTGELVTLQYYWNDSNCTRGLEHHGNRGHDAHHSSGHRTGLYNDISHTEDADIRHLGYHLAWDIYDHYAWYGASVDIVAHSMGGLIARYAIAGVQNGLPNFPPSIRVEDAVTMGTPHGGTRVPSPICLNCNTQVQQMFPGSSVLKWLEDYGWNPQGTGGTDWTTMGSDDDNFVAADRGAATDSDRDPIDKYMGSCHKAWYVNGTGIEHSDWRKENFDSENSLAWVRRCGVHSWLFFTDALWPGRRADYAVTYGSY